MTIASYQIANRALQLVGTRTTLTALPDATTNEGIQIGVAYDPTLAWCFGLANWNFARKTAALTLTKSVAAGPPQPWTSASPSPPWKREFLLPADFVQARYVTNSDINSTTNYVGEPKRMQIATDTITAVVQQVLLTDAQQVVLVYTASLTDPTGWPWYFERLMVHALAATISYVLTGDKELSKRLDDQVMRQFLVAEEANRKEGLMFEDTTVEWIQAIGINYPFRRDDGKPKAPPQQAPQR